MAPATSTPSPRERRRRAILDLIAAGDVHSQAELADRLAESGIEVNQGTLSRDLRALGVVKGPEGYEPPRGAGPSARDASARLLQALRQFLRSATPAQNQIVVRTPPGGAQPLAVALDQAGPDGVLGTIGGDDTILVVTPDVRTARRVARWLLARAGERS